MRWLSLCAALAVGCGDGPPEDVCSDLDFDECSLEARCAWEAGTIQCLQLCRDGAGCPEGLTCVEDSVIDHCQGDKGCLAFAIVDDVCRAGAD